MASSTGTVKKVFKKKRTRLSLGVKLKIIKKLEKGEKVTCVGDLYNLNESTIRTIRKNADAIKMAVKETIPSNSKVVKYARNTVIVKMEKLLIQWMEDNSKKHFALNTRSIRTKAMLIFTVLRKENGLGDDDLSSFAASNGWFGKFKKRYNLHNIVGNGGANAGKGVTAKYVRYLKIYIETNGYSARQVFNATDTALFWKRMPSCTFLGKTENGVSSFECADDRLSLLFCANASGNYKCKPLLIHHTAHESHCELHCKVNRKSQMTARLFEDWFTNIFCPEIEEYCLHESIPFKILLVIDNAPSHLVNLDRLNPNVKVLFLTPNATALLQPLDQGVIGTFKTYYLKYMLKQMLDEQMLTTTANKQMTLHDIWHNYRITDAMENIAAAWTDITNTTMNVVWKNLWPDCVANVTDDDSLAKIIDSAVIEIIKLGRQLKGEGFSVLDMCDIEELLKSHDVELTTRDLIELNQKEHKREEQEEEYKKEEQEEEYKKEEQEEEYKKEEQKERQQENGVKQTPYLFTTENIQKSIGMIKEAIDFIESIDPDKERSHAICTALNAQIAPYEHIVEERRQIDEHYTGEVFFTPSTSTAITLGHSYSENDFE